MSKSENQYYSQEFLANATEHAAVIYNAIHYEAKLEPQKS